MISGTAGPVCPGDDGSGQLLTSHYTSSRREMISIANSLFATGVTVDIEIPMIAVVGSQSAGKSSLIEAISGITLPRAHGTCTRCPTYCRLKNTPDTWNCRVSLMYTTDFDGEPIPVTIEHFGDDITDKDDVTERIRRAQRAILNRSTPAHEFLEGPDRDPDVSQVTFSNNCVYLEISGPDVPDLSFVDLPGIIATSVSGVEGEIELIRGLVTEYVSKESCIILLTISCETELDNQGGYELVRTFDPHGKRTIGVLTKPDRISPGDEPQWLSVLLNQNPKIALENGWFSVKSPNTLDLTKGVTHQQAREEERGFFSRTQPWCDLGLQFRKQLGSECLAERCSTVLSSLMAKKLPEIQELIQKTLQATELQLSELPKEASADPIGEVYNMISKFSSELNKYLEGTPGPDGLLQSIRPYQESFKKAIRATAPDFRPYDRPRREVEDAVRPEIEVPEFLSNEEEPQHVPDDEKAIYIDEVAKRAQQAITRELPDHYPFLITREYIRQTIDEWESPTRQVFDEVEAVLSTKIKEFIGSEFSQYPLLQQHVIAIVTDHIARCAESSKEYLNRLLAVERRPRTLNEHYYRDYRDKFLSYYKRHRPQFHDISLQERLKTYDSNSPVDGALHDSVSRLLAGFNEIGINGLSPTDLAKVLPSDPREAAINIMASVRAYFQVAYKRFVDNIVIVIDDELILGLNRKQGLESALRQELGVSGPDGFQICSSYLKEDAIVAKYREDLRNKRGRLMQAKKELMKLRI